MTLPEAASARRGRGISPQGAAGIGLVVLGSLVGSPLVVVLGVAAILFDAVRAAWAGRVLDRVVYRRHLADAPLVAGDEVPFAIEIWNAQRLPLPWVRVDDRASASVEIRERRLSLVEDFGVALRNAWTLAPHERVTRHFTLRGTRRGIIELGPARLEAGDLFARSADTRVDASVERRLVRPRVVPVRIPEAGDPWGLAERARRGLLEHPTSYAGVREYRPGDPVRRIHARTSARIGRPVVKRFDPARERDVLLVLDIQTGGGPPGSLTFEEDLAEELCVAAGSIAARLLADGAAVGLAVAAYAASLRRIAFLAPSEARDQLGRILDTLARLSPFPSASFEQLAANAARFLRPGVSIVVLTARDPRPLAPVLRRLDRSGFRATVLTLGAGAEAGRPALRGASVASRTLRVDGGWRTPERVVVE
ncbi:MAG TPA: DUF58 domain-containing protein [Candidatus Limnocylindrales bacterium]|nr:DUF58 domain-containing protein [Candidatus Limnocylindrales bacterium]